MSKTIVILIHGFNIKDGGKSTVDKLLPYLQDYLTHQFDYGWIDFFRTDSLNKKLVPILAEVYNGYKELGYKVVVVGHSNGCAIANLAAEHCQISNDDCFIYINPALSTLAYPTQICKTYVLWSEYDQPTRLYKWVEKAIPVIKSKWRPWGDMAARGYTGKLKCMVNINLNALYFSNTGNYIMFQHSTYFDDKVLPITGMFIQELCEHG